MAQVSVVSFDVFGTLLDIDEDKNRPEAYQHLARWLSYQGIGIDGLELQHRLDTRTAEELSRNKEPYPDVDISLLLESTIEELAPGSCRIVKELVPQAALLLRTLTTPSLSPIPGALESIKALAGDFRLGICSNTQRAYTIGELRMFELLDPFEHIVFSSDIKACKPNPKIFEALLKKFDEPPECVLHVGDRVSEDILGPSAVGMRTVLFERGLPACLQARDASMPRVTPIIRTLTDLPQVIRSLNAGQ